MLRSEFAAYEGAGLSALRFECQRHTLLAEF